MRRSNRCRATRRRRVPARSLLRVRACAVCRTDLHIVDGELPLSRLPLVPGHEIVGTVEALGAGVDRARASASASACRGSAAPAAAAPIARAGARTCATSRCSPATRATAASPRTCWPMRATASRSTGLAMDDASAAPLLCAGLIGWRALKAAGDATGARPLRLRRRRAPDRAGGACAGRARCSPSRGPATTPRRRSRARSAATGPAAPTKPPPEPLDAAILFAPVGALVPPRCRGAQGRPRRVRRHPHERHPVVSLLAAVARATAALGRQPHATRRSSWRWRGSSPLRVARTRFSLAHANEALARLREGRRSVRQILVP